MNCVKSVKNSNNNGIKIFKLVILIQLGGILLSMFCGILGRIIPLINYIVGYIITPVIVVAPILCFYGIYISKQSNDEFSKKKLLGIILNLCLILFNLFIWVLFYFVGDIV